MIYTIVSVFDRAAQAFGRPVYTNSKGLAVRSFTDEVNRPDRENQMNTHPEDFDLFLLGTFDDSNGLYVLETPPTMLQRAQDVLVPKV